MIFANVLPIMEDGFGTHGTREYIQELTRFLNPESCRYPEQLDCTFDFIPRMSEKQNETNCDRCPMKLNSEKSGITNRIPEEFCSPDETKFCPFLLFACGYETPCCDVKDFCPNRQS